MFERWVVKPLERVRIRTKLVGIFIFGMALIGGAFALMLAKQLSVAEHFQSQMAAQKTAQNAVYSLNNEFKTQVQEWKNLLLRGREPKDYWVRVENHQASIQSTAQALESQLKTLGMTQEAGVIAQFRIDHKALFSGYQRGERALAQGASVAEVDSSVRGLDRAPTSALISSAEAMEAHREANLAAMNDAVKSTLIGGASVIGFLMLLFVWGGRTLALRAVVQPTERVRAYLGRLAEGDFRTELKLDRGDEMGDLARYANALQKQLSGVLKEVEQSGHSVSLASEELDRVSEQNVARAQMQRDQTHQVASAMAQMTASVVEVARHAQHAADQVARSDQESNEGQAILNRTIGDLESLDQTLQEAGGAVSRLATESHEIGGILDVIRNIADQTNLLALNAAIEAARAGEQGRGFAVVADEVRSLSLRTQEATGEIQQMIDKLQKGAQQAVEAMSAGQHGSQCGLSQTREAGEALAKISAQLTELNGMNAQIATAAEEQSKVSEEINHSVGQIRELGDQVANDVEVGRAVGKGLQQNADQLAAQLSRFQLASAP
ncbi:methyl-accepting chemotaxis protein [Ferrimonas balearica]|uniref:methyl-accepting chemotaxis protein n=1 Tax=Ferrimonas balearica TaxID=44012 RepID=UPI001C999DCA|nr:methyl-accepting chemotaxis protein [Ferrimonas balearica]MBY5922894.1 methyl-accepting chemotaxis protein [Ferrimonas balearica]MBY5997729.1 methyl-accepting chemotaxis protein [Ferrimonas balearica]